MTQSARRMNALKIVSYVNPHSNRRSFEYRDCCDAVSSKNECVENCVICKITFSIATEDPSSIESTRHGSMSRGKPGNFQVNYLPKSLLYHLMIICISQNFHHLDISLILSLIPSIIIFLETFWCCERWVKTFDPGVDIIIDLHIPEALQVKIVSSWLCWQQALYMYEVRLRIVHVLRCCTAVPAAVCTYLVRVLRTSCPSSLSSRSWRCGARNHRGPVSKLFSFGGTSHHSSFFILHSHTASVMGVHVHMDRHGSW